MGMNTKKVTSFEEMEEAQETVVEKVEELPTCPPPSEVE